MTFPSYYLSQPDFHQTAYLCSDGWWRFKDEWGVEIWKGHGDSIFQNDYLKYNRNSHNLIFSYETK